ncbi:MAG: hypothetical protein IKZ50_01455 [Bacteroidales bacterium]|nr:hypothetical protein [Bacteroidales bacterium]
MAHLVDCVKLCQGSILDGVDWGQGESNPLSIVLTYDCDIINDKASYIILAALIPAKPTIVTSKEYLSRIQGYNNGEISKEKWKKIKEFIEGYIYNKGVTRYYFIDPHPILDAPYLLVDFQHIMSIPFDQSNQLETIAQLPSPYKEQMMVQFASYAARIPVDREEDTTPIVSDIVSPIRQKNSDSI